MSFEENQQTNQDMITLKNINGTVRVHGPNGTRIAQNGEQVASDETFELDEGSSCDVENAAEDSQAGAAKPDSSGTDIDPKTGTVKIDDEVLYSLKELAEGEDYKISLPPDNSTVRG